MAGGGIAAERADRVVAALLANLADWELRVEEISTHAIPVTGNLHRALTLLRDMKRVRIGLRRLVDLTDL